MKKTNHLSILIIAVLFSACQNLNDGVNDNLNDLPIEDLAATDFFIGAQLGNIQVQVGHLQRISSLWTRQLIGFQSSYLSLDQHNITTAESNAVWNRAYQSTLSQLRTIQEKAIDDPQLLAITQIIEANTIGTMAALFGDVPYSQAVTQEELPVFDSQVDILTKLIDLLDKTIATIQSLSSPRSITQDIFFNGDMEKWLETAWTLKARFHLLMRDYPAAQAAAENGISSDLNSMKYHPIADGNADSNNLFWLLAAGSRQGDIGNLKGNELSYLLRMLSDSSVIKRTHGKTIETARLAYYTIDAGGDADSNQGVAQASEAMPIVTYAENQLIVAETISRNQGLANGLTALNKYRVWLSSGEAFGLTDPSLALKYNELDEDDLEEDGLENRDGIEPIRALLREIIEERYVSGFGTWMPFDDARRLRDTEPDLMVPFPIHPNGGACHPERFPYSANELDANSNAPADPGICAKTEINN